MRKIILLAALLLPTSAHAQILINEIAWMGTDVSSSDEWIELYNYSAEDIDLTNWRLEASDGSPAVSLEGVIKAESFFLLERTDDQTVPEITADQFYTGALSNIGENLVLYDNTDKIIDEVNSAEGWLAGDNTTKQTMERVNLDIWATSLEPLGTPKAVNSQAGEEDTEEPQDNIPPPAAEAGLTKAKRGDIIITEVLANPNGIDLDKEFIEIKNVSGREIDLTSWIIKNSAKQEFVIPSLTMSHGSIVVFYRWQTNLALDNYKEKITLYTERGNVIDKVDYKDAPEGLSYQLDDEGSWHSLTPSPGEENDIPIYIQPTAKINGPKEAKVNTFVSFDASDSFDPEKRSLKFYWDFDQGYLTEGLIARQFYDQPGTYEFSLTAFVDENSSSTEKFKIKITGQEKNAAPTSTKEEVLKTEATYVEPPFIFISEFLPNPKGSDNENEFIEIFNNDQMPVNLSGWQLSDGAKTFTFGDEVIKPGQYLAIYRPQTKIALNNDEDEIKLIMPNGEVIDLVSYEGVKEGQSFVLDENFIWQKTSTPSPGEINILDNKESQEILEPTSTPKVLGAATKETIPENQPANKDKYIFAGLASVTVLGLGAILKIKKY